MRQTEWIFDAEAGYYESSIVIGNGTVIMKLRHWNNGQGVIRLGNGAMVHDRVKCTKADLGRWVTAKLNNRTFDEVKSALRVKTQHIGGFLEKQFMDQLKPFLRARIALEHLGYDIGVPVLRQKAEPGQDGYIAGVVIAHLYDSKTYPLQVQWDDGRVFPYTIDDVEILDFEKHPQLKTGDLQHAG